MDVEVYLGPEVRHRPGSHARVREALETAGHRGAPDLPHLGRHQEADYVMHGLSPGQAAAVVESLNRLPGYCAKMLQEKPAPVLALALELSD
ncbi:MAG: hypothetical protein HY520_04245 [Candidatus Aenigmarchaeota archaeon]|nr:hypothetical protein [Candidatus Aenigmarchaeota archaeon]